MKYLLELLLAANALVAQTRTVPVEIEFVGKIGPKTTYDMRGDLTLRGEMHPIEVRVVQMDAKSLEASFSIDRTKWSVGTGPAALFVSDNVDLVAKVNLN